MAKLLNSVRDCWLRPGINWRSPPGLRWSHRFSNVAWHLWGGKLLKSIVSDKINACIHVCTDTLLITVCTRNSCMTPLVIGLPYDHPHASGSWQFVYKKLWLLGNGQQTAMHEHIRITCICTIHTHKHNVMHNMSFYGQLPHLDNLPPHHVHVTLCHFKSLTIVS